MYSHSPVHWFAPGRLLLPKMWERGRNATVRFVLLCLMKWLRSLSLWECIDSSSKQLWGGAIIAAFVHLSWKAACFTPLALNVSLPICSLRLIKCLCCGSARAAQPRSEKTLLFLFVPWYPKLESCFLASWWPELCGNCLKDALPSVPHGPITPLSNLRGAGHLEPIKRLPLKLSHLSSFQKHEGTLQYTQEQRGRGAAMF